jgi:isopenicillin-N epimerase
VVIWGWESDHPSDSRFIDHHEWQGTRDISPFLAAGAAIDFVRSHDWHTVQGRGHAGALRARRSVNGLTGLSSISPDEPTDHEWIGHLTSIRLPDHTDVVALKDQLLDRFRVEVPVLHWNDQPFVRVSYVAYTTDTDVDVLVHALGELLDLSPRT